MCNAGHKAGEDPGGEEPAPARGGLPHHGALHAQGHQRAELARAGQARSGGGARRARQRGDGQDDRRQGPRGRQGGA
eukprot:455639-Pyramimonas_sp.AAC.1